MNAMKSEMSEAMHDLNLNQLWFNVGRCGLDHQPIDTSRAEKAAKDYLVMRGCRASHAYKEFQKWNCGYECDLALAQNWVTADMIANSNMLPLIHEDGYSEPVAGRLTIINPDINDMRTHIEFLTDLNNNYSADYDIVSAKLSVVNTKLENERRMAENNLTGKNGWMILFWVLAAINAVALINVNFFGDTLCG